jgi:peptidoglycan hydrolase CwlO-like protein
VVAASAPLLEEQLNTVFADNDRRIEYVNQTLSLVQSASARAWALNRLADRYTPHAVAVLDDEERRKLQVLLTDHVSALSEDISSLQNQLGEILSGASNTPAANTSVNTPLKSDSTHTLEVPEDWRDRTRRVHSSTEAVHEAVVTLLSSSQPSDQNDTNAIEVNLRTSLTQLQTELQALNQIVHETDLK